MYGSRTGRVQVAYGSRTGTGGVRVADGYRTGRSVRVAYGCVLSVRVNRGRVQVAYGSRIGRNLRVAYGSRTGRGRGPTIRPQLKHNVCLYIYIYI